MNAQSARTTTSQSTVLVFILTLGVFGILNTEMGVIGMLPLIADTFQVSVPDAGWTVTIFALVVVLLLLFALGSQFSAVLGLVLLFGVLTGLSNNNSQYMIVRSAAEAPEFANGLFLSAANAGTAVGAALCGLFIGALGTRYAVAGALICLGAATLAIFMVYREQQCHASATAPLHWVESTE